MTEENKNALKRAKATGVDMEIIEARSKELGNFQATRTQMLRIMKELIERLIYFKTANKMEDTYKLIDHIVAIEAKHEQETREFLKKNNNSSVYNSLFMKGTIVQAFNPDVFRAWLESSTPKELEDFNEKIWKTDVHHFGTFHSGVQR